MPISLVLNTTQAQIMSWTHEGMFYTTTHQLSSGPVIFIQIMSQLTNPHTCFMSREEEKGEHRE